MDIIIDLTKEIKLSEEFRFKFLDFIKNEGLECIKWDVEVSMARHVVTLGKSNIIEHNFLWGLITVIRIPKITRRKLIKNMIKKH